MPLPFAVSPDTRTALAFGTGAAVGVYLVDALGRARCSEPVSGLELVSGALIGGFVGLAVCRAVCGPGDELGLMLVLVPP